MSQPESSFSHRAQRSWEKITVTVPSSNAETIASFMATLSTNGIEQISRPSNADGPDLEEIIGYFSDEQHPTQVISKIHAFLENYNQQKSLSTPAVLAHESLLEEDWNRRWKEHFKPFKLTDRLVIRPSWEEYTQQPNEIVIEMDPGMAFGTGLHASTKLALLLIEEAYTSNIPKTVLDVGTGTGILGMDCGLLGAKQVIGLDNDIDARTAASENIRKNHLESIMSIDSRDLGDLDSHFDLVIANITQDVLTLLANDLYRLLATGGRLVLSGILTGGQTDVIKTVFGGLGLILVTTKSLEEWTALLFEKR